MKTHLLKITVLALILTASAYSCKKWFEPPPPKLPPETQEGKHTFGCYVNGALFVPEPGTAGDGNPSLRANYWRSSNRLDFDAYAKNGFLTFTVYPEENNKKIITWITYCDRVYTYKNTGEILFTRFDLENMIVSGTFTCETLHGIRITQGRFDIKMYPYNIRE